MPAHPPFRRRLLVEGAKDLRVIPYLMEANGVSWPDDRKHAPVQIRDEGGSKLLPFLESEEFHVEVREPSLMALGVILDSDGGADHTWRRVRHRCSAFVENLAETIPPEGLIAATTSGKRFGVWIMPDNRSVGMMESFLKYLVPTASADSWTFARQSVVEARQHGATYREVQTDKANMHTWLAWQDEPGRQLHEAIHHRILDPTSPHARPFVNWFRQLFQV